jgi:reactive intermediate/imine deaminase
VFTAGQVPETEEGEVLNDAPIKQQTDQCLKNLKTVLESEGLTLEHILKTTVYVVDIQNWEMVNEAYGEHFQELPARTTVGVTGLWGGVDVEIEAVATTELE